MTLTPKKIAVLGGGPSGLAAAWRLARNGYGVVLFEKSRVIGGLAAGFEMNGNVYEYGPHIFHSSDEEIMNDVKSIAADIMFPVEKPILIKFRGSYFKYPLTMSDVVSKLPISTILRAAFSFIGCRIRYLFVRPARETSETVLIRNYGSVLYEIFFKNYIEHVWGMPPSGFSAGFARQRIPSLSAFSFIFKFVSGLHGLIRRRVSTKGFVENMEGVIYSTKKGFSAIAERMAAEITRLGASILRESAVTGVERLADGRFSVTTRQGRHDGLFDGVISTIPISEFASILKPPVSAAAARAASELKFRSLVFVGLLVSKPRVLPAALMYYRDLSFNRITDLSYFGTHTVPEGSTMLIAEITCSTDDREWKDKDLVSRRVIEELVAEGLFKKDMILESHVFGYEHAYPVYAFGYEEKLDTVLKGLKPYAGVETTGRQGLFGYVNIHIAMKMGYDAADSIMERSAG